MRAKIPRERRRSYFVTYYAKNREAITAARRARYAAKVAAKPAKEPRPPLVRIAAPRVVRAKVKPSAVVAPKPCEQPQAVSVRERFAKWRKGVDA